MLLVGQSMYVPRAGEPADHIRRGRRGSDDENLPARSWLLFLFLIGVGSLQPVNRRGFSATKLDRTSDTPSSWRGMQTANHEGSLAVIARECELQGACRITVSAIQPQTAGQSGGRTPEGCTVHVSD